MKGLILSGGKGTRLRPLTYTGAKQLVPVANKPVLFYAIEDLVEAGITDICIVVGDTADQIREAVGDGSRFGAAISYIEQDAPRGIAHAVKVAQPFLGDEKFVLFLGDNFLRGGIVDLVDRFKSNEINALIVLKEVPNPGDFGIAELEEGRVVRVVEKPKEPRSNLAVTGIYMFDSSVFEAVNAISPSPRGELEITDTIQYLIDNGQVVDPFFLEDWWIDTGKMEDILEANRLMLEVLPPANGGEVDDRSTITGNVVLEAGCQIINSVVRGPAIIGERTRVIDSYIGPFSSIYHDGIIENTEIQNSVVLERCRIKTVGHRLDSSLIGRDVVINESNLKPRAHKLVLGDFSKLDLV